MKIFLENFPVTSSKNLRNIQFTNDVSGILHLSSCYNSGLQNFGQKHMYYHGTIIRTRITCKKILCYMRDSACRWFIVENAKR